MLRVHIHVQKADGQLAFRGLVATPDGKKTYETSRMGTLTGGQSWLAVGLKRAVHVLPGRSLACMPCAEPLTLCQPLI